MSDRRDHKIQILMSIIYFESKKLFSFRFSSPLVFLIFSVVLMLFAGCFAQKTTEQIFEESVVLPPVWFGETGEVRHVFMVSNDSILPLKVLDTSNSCTCTNITLDSQIIQPNEKISLEMVSDIQGRKGLFFASCLLKMSNETLRKFEIRMDIYDHLEIEPDVFYFDDIEPNEKCSQKFRLIAYSRGNVEFNDKCFIVEPNVDDGFNVWLGQPIVSQLADGIKKIELDGILNFIAPNEYGDGNFTVNVKIKTDEGIFYRSVKAYCVVSGRIL